MKLVIGLIGKIGSGKTIIGEYLHERYGASQHMFSQILIDILDRLYLPHNREYLQKLGASLRKSIDEDVIVTAFEKDLENDKSEIVVVDGIRYENEVEMLRRFENNLLLYITSPVEIRYERCRRRGEKGETKISLEEFLSAEKQETEKHIDEIGKFADYTLENTVTKKELFRRIDEILKIVVKNEIAECKSQNSRDKTAKF